MNFFDHSKRYIFLCLLMMISLAGFTQQPAQVNYQGVARKADGSPVAEQAITLRLAIRDGGATSPVVYSETRTLMTNKFGLFNTVIGSSGSSSQTGSMTIIAWSTGNKFLQVELDPEGGNNFLNLGTSQLQSVPYAIYASQALPFGNANGDLSGTYPNPTVSKLQGSPVSALAPQNGQILKWNGTSWAPADASGSAAQPITVTASAPLNASTTGSSISLTVNKADASTDGYLTRTDWLLFNDKASKEYVDNAVGGLSAIISAENARALAAEALKENAQNKSTNLTTDAASDVKYPSVKSVKTYVDAIIPATTPDADANTKGKIQLAGDLSGTAAAPVIADGKITNAKIASGISASKVGLGNVNNTSDDAKPVSAATQIALDSREQLANKSMDLATDGASDVKYPSVKSVKTYVDATIAAGTPDAAAATKGKIQLAGDLSGTAAEPVIADGKITDAKIAPGISASKVGLGNVNNTTDAAKPISTLTQAALDLKGSTADLALKAPLASPTFTGTVSGITKTMVGLSDVNNTTDAAKPISTLTQAALDLKSSTADLALKAALASPTFTGTVSGITKAMVGLSDVDNTTDAAKPISTLTQAALDLKGSTASLALKAPLASPTFTGTVSGITKTMVGLGDVDNTTDAAKPISTLTQAALDLKGSTASLALKAPLASPTFTGTVSGITKAMVGLSDVDNTTDAAKPISTLTQAALDLKGSTASLALKAPLASPAFTGTVSGITKTMVGLSDVDNTTDAAKPVSTLTQTALGLKAPLESPTFTGTVGGISKAMVGLGDVDNTTDAAKPISTLTQAALDLKGSTASLALKAPLASPTFTGTVSGITKTMVGLSDVDNTTDAAKPVSTLTQTALGLKAPLESPTFTGTVGGITKAMVGLGDVDNTTDAAKPISTLTQTALNARELTANKSTDVTADAASDTKYPSVKSVKTYVDAAATPDADATTKGKIQLAGDLAGTAASPVVAAGAITNAKISASAAIADTKLATISTSGKVANSATTAASANTASAIVARDASGDFSAGTITAALTGNASTATSSTTATNIAGGLLGGIPYQTAAGATSILAGNITTTKLFLSQTGNATISAAPVWSAFPSDFSTDITVNGVAMGKGAGSVASNTAMGVNALSSNTTGSSNTAIGFGTLKTNVTNNRNTGVGADALSLNVANDNTAMGYRALMNNAAGQRNVAVGVDGLWKNTTGNHNTAVGIYALSENTTGTNNTSLGSSTLRQHQTGDGNTAVGFNSATSLVTGANNTAIGTQALEQSNGANNNTAVGVAAIDRNTTGGNNAVLGAYAGRYISDGATYNTIINNSVLIGTETRPNASSETNQVVIGYQAIGNGSNTIQLGNTSITNVKTSGTITAGVVTYPKTDGATGQALVTNGSGVLGWGSAGTVVREVADEFTATAAQTSFTLAQTPSANSKVKMFVNGIRISNTAYGVVGTTLTYIPANNGSYTLLASDRIQLDYFY